MKKPSLNHRYRLIWSRIQHAWVAVSEHVKSGGKQSTATRKNATTSTLKSLTRFTLTKKTQLAMLVVSALFLTNQNAFAQWTDLTIQSGQASIQQQGNHLDVSVSTAKVIGTASSLDISAHESVNVFFNQGGGNGLFRSTGNSATNIMGGLTSNGNLFLINQNGVLFGQGAQVNVGGLVASTMNINDADFLSGQYQFNANGSQGNVSNLGTLKVSDGGYLVLLGKEVSNSGTLTANRGSVVMASADSAILDFYGNGLVKAKLSGDALQAVVNQSGNIQANGGAIQLATNSRSSAVNVSGLVQANSLVERNGVIRLEGGSRAKVAVSGIVSTSGKLAGTTGGNIEVTGEQVALLGHAKLDASGDAGGGQVLVGGDYQGQNNAVYNARTNYAGENTSINVNANQTGDAGKAIVWADQTTRYYGDISAQGGAISGDGGFVEVSGKQNLAFAGTVDVTSANGTGGTVLFDPENIILNNTTQVAPTNNANGTPDVAFADAPVAGTTTIQINDVRGFSELYLQATNDITVANTLSMFTDNSVFLEANNDINVNAEISTRGTGAITLNADNNVNINGRLNSYGSGAINVTADADSNGTGDININQRVFARTGGINFNAANVVSTTTAGYLQTQGNVNQDSSDINMTASNTINMASNIISTGRNSAAGFDGVSGGDVNLAAAGAITVNNISAYGGNGGTGNTAGGDAGTITIQSTAAGDINTGTLNARNGVARGTGAGGATASINITNANGDVDTKNLYVHGNTNGNAGEINVTASNGNITATGSVYASGGGTAAGSIAAGGNGGNINMNASGDVTVTSRVYAQGATPRNGNTAVGGNAGNVNISGANLSFDNVIYAYGGNGRGLNQAGGNAGNINLNATGAIATKQVYAYGGSGASGAGSNANGGNAGAITIASTGAGDINTTNTINARSGAARGTGLAGSAGSINITNTDGDIATRNLETYGNLNGHGGDINVGATTGNVTVTGRVYSYGGTVNNGHTLAGRDGGDINISGMNRTITSRVNANGNTAKGTDQAGGNAGTVSIAGSGTLNVADVYSRNGRATGTGAGGNVGGVTLTGSTVTASSTISTSGERNGDAGNINITSSTGATNVKNVYATGGAANTDTAGNNAGNITIDSAGALVTTNVYANGSAGNGLNQDGGNAGTVDINAVSAITMNAVNATGGTGGNAAGSNANGGNAGVIDIRSTAAGDININNTLSMHSGFARGAGNGGSEGSITVKNDDGNINTRNIYAEGYNHGNGSNVTLDAEGAGDVTVTGQVRAYGDTSATGDRAGANGGDVLIKGVNTTVTSTINANGGRARGIDQSGGDAGTVAVMSSGDARLQNVYVRNGNATGTGVGGNVGSISVMGASITTANLYAQGDRNGDGGIINLTSTSGDIATTGLYVQGGGANTNTAGNNAGNITVNSVGGFSASNHLYAQGSSGNGVDSNGGDAGTINVIAAGAISAKRVYAYGGNGGGNNALTNLAAGGNAGSVTLSSTATGDITLNDTVNVRTGYSRGAAPGATAGTINLANANGNINTRNIRAEGQNHGNGSDVTINAGTTGDVTVNGVIYTYGDRDATNTTFVGTDGGDITITAANTTVTDTISTEGGRGRGANQIGGDAGDVSINASAAISTQAIAANGGNAGVGAGSNAAGGDAGNVSIASTGAGDIATTTISARTGYTRGAATATGAGLVNIQNDDGALITGNITTRGQRRGVGGDITVVTTGGDIAVGTVDARASNLAATDGGDVTLATTTGDATVPNILTGGRWLVYSGDPRNDTVGAFKSTADFKQYNTNYGDALLGGGDGFVYRFAPTITTSLTGTATKPYDANTVASTAGLTLNKAGGEIDGDVINISGLTSATYDNKEVGTGKTVTSNPLTVVNGNNGTTAVYGYQVDAATGNVGEITESALSVAEQQAEVAAASNPRNDAGLGGLIEATNQQQFLAVVDIGATAAGGEGDGDSATCENEPDKKLNNPNTSLMLNFGVNLPAGVKRTCVF